MISTYGFWMKMTIVVVLTVLASSSTESRSSSCEGTSRSVEKDCEDKVASQQSPLSFAQALRSTTLLVPLLVPEEEQKRRRDEEKPFTFWKDCFEQRPCIIRSNTESHHLRETLGMPLLMRILNTSSGSWLLEELSHSKRETCRVRKLGCLWQDTEVNSLPFNYFTQSAAARQAKRDITASVKVQDDIVVGDTMSRVKAEEELVEFLRGQRGIVRTRSFLGDAGKVTAEEWLKFANESHRTLIVRDADGRHRALHNVALEVKASPGGLRGIAAEVGVSLYYTPENIVSSVPKHIDVMDVLALQIVGRKRWILSFPRASYMLPLASIPVPLSSGVLLHAGSDRSQQHNTVEITLNEGDWLYVPRGVIHSTSTTALKEASLHVSVGVETSPRLTWVHFLGNEMQRRDDVVGDDDNMTSDLSAEVRALFEFSAAEGDRLVGPLLKGCGTTFTEQIRQQRQMTEIAVMKQMRRYVSRALLHALAKEVLSLRASGELYAQVAARIEEEVANEGGDSALERLEQEVLLQRVLDTETQLKQYLSESSASMKGVIAKRWTRMMAEALGEVAGLRSSSELWWHTFAQQDRQDNLIDEKSECGGGNHQQRVDLETAIWFMHDVVWMHYKQQAAMRSTDPEFWERLANGLLLDELAGLRGGGGHTLLQGWNLWQTRERQVAHDERLAFAEWLWINEQLST